MPRALYAISYEQTGLVLSYCEMAKQDLSKTGAVAALLDQIVGDELVLSFSFSGLASPGPIKIDKSLLNVDELSVAPKDVPKTTDIVFDTSTYKLDVLMLDLSDASAKAGDGTVKKLLASSDMQTATPSLFSDTPPTGDPATTLSVALQNDALATKKFYAIIDGQPQQTFVAGPPPANPITFASTVPLSKSSWHTVIFASRTYQPFFGLLQAK